MKLRNLLIASMGLAMAAAGAGAASAATPWQVQHERQVEANHRYHRIAHLNRDLRIEHHRHRFAVIHAYRVNEHLHRIRMQELRHERLYGPYHHHHHFHP